MEHSQAEHRERGRARDGADRRRLQRQRRRKRFQPHGVQRRPDRRRRDRDVRYRQDRRASLRRRHEQRGLCRGHGLRRNGAESTITDTGTVTIYDFVCTFSIENRTGTKGLVKYRGTLSADSASASTAKIGTTIITADHQLSSYLLWNVTKGEKKCITDSANGTPDVLTFSPNSDSGNWSNGDAFRIMIDVPCSPLRQQNLDSNGNAIVGAFFDTSHACDSDCATNLTVWAKDGGALSGRKMSDDGAQITTLAATIGSPVNIGGGGTTIAANLSDLGKPAITFSGTADSGTKVSMVDAALTQADANYWTRGTRITFTSGNIAGQSACVNKFTPGGSATLEFDRPFTQAIATQLYILTPDAACRQ
jgi:hypothetical protein